MKRLITYLITFLVAVNVKAQLTDDYVYLKEISIDGSKIEGASAHLNFPVLISLTDADLRTLENGGTMHHPEAWDLIFTLNDCETQLVHEVEYFNAVTGELICWVRMPEMVPGEDQIIYMVYSNSTISEAPITENVWENAYTGVYHFDQLEDTTDRSPQENDAVNYFVENEAEAKIKGGRLFDDLGDYIEVGFNGMDGRNGTVSMWAKPTSFSYPSRYFFGHTSIPSYADRIQLYTGHWTVDSNALNLGFGDAHLKELEMAFLDTNEWVYVTCAWNSNDFITKVYLNGIEVGNQPFAGLEAYGIANIGNNGSEAHDQGFDGIIDEVHIASQERTAGWIKTAYNNQVDVATFYSFSEAVLTNEVCGEDTLDHSGINAEAINCNFYIYPNPAQNQLNIVCPVSNENPTITIYNAYGQQVLVEVAENHGAYGYRIDLSACVPGLYIANIVQGHSHNSQSFVIAR